MRDPYYAGIMLKVESHICAFDRQAQEEGELRLVDSDVKSGIRKALSLLAGRRAASVPQTDRDRWKARLGEELAGLGESLFQQPGIPLQDFVRTLYAVEESLKTRREIHGHSRGYLDYLKGFLANVPAGVLKQAGPSPVDC